MNTYWRIEMQNGAVVFCGPLPQQLAIAMLPAFRRAEAVRRITQVSVQELFNEVGEIECKSRVLNTVAC